MWRISKVPLSVLSIIAVLTLGSQVVMVLSSYTFTPITDNGYVPRFLPEGKWIAYSKWEDTIYQVVVQRIDDPSTLKVVDDGAGLTDGAVSRHGRSMGRRFTS